MKKILTSLFFISAITYSFGQSLRLYNGATEITATTFTVTISANVLQANDIDIHNITGSSVNFKIRRTILSPPMDSTCAVYFCAGSSCYAPSALTVFNEPGSGTSLAGMTNLTGAQGLIAHFDVGAACCETYIKYQVYNTNLAGDTATVTIHYTCASGVDDIEKAKGTISNAYPNPANSIVAINYEVNNLSYNGKIVIYDMLGKQVKEFIITDKQGVAKINVTDLNDGIYFYSFLMDGKAIATRKLVVSSK
ncbi:MAG: hypothetical protein A3F72_01340 [Bacteroidetes bacterium RIFCSPLOWO2_12_FULL_35_15]|nr:MAG: hypothetical protein A3F72_01340 [Bacteroidetes bacterium RIFCSPLOWO2_12_FULL_35_15]